MDLYVDEDRKFLPLIRGFSADFFTKKEIKKDRSLPTVRHLRSSSTTVNYTYNGYGNRRRGRSSSLGEESDLTKSCPKTIRKQISFILEDGVPIAGLRGFSNVEKNELLQNKNDDEIGNPVYISFIYGVINSIIVLPVMLSFGSIIYRDPAFAPYMPLLMKLTLVSAMIHQLCFSTLSSMKFAVGQVQDAGLIFLSSMASDIVKSCHARGYSDEVLLATATIGLSTATLLLGVGLVILGKLKLAQYVQKLPTSIINGYLAYIGFFCGISGLALMTPSDKDSGESSKVSLTSIMENYEYLLPGVLGGSLIYLLVRKIGHISVLPLCIMFMLMAFYALLWATGTTVVDVTEEGWIPKADPPPIWYHTWDYLRFENVAWDVLPSQTLTLFGMTFVVALSSSLDVAAIEAELATPLDYNSELTMVGISNMVSGATGGYTGSYIFSQTIFYLRSGIRSRLAGYCVALCEFFIIVLPFNILSYVPNFFFGSLLIMLCVDLMYEYLWEARTKLSKSEHAICLLTFFLIQLLGVEFGILAGFLVQTIFSKLFGKQEEQQSAKNDELIALKANNNNELCQKDLYGSMLIPPLLSEEKKDDEATQ